MRQKAYSPELLQALKESLRHLEDVRVNPDDPDLKALKQNLRAKIAELERLVTSE